MASAGCCRSANSQKATRLCFRIDLLALSELEEAISQVSQKVLIQQLRELEAHGLVRRGTPTEGSSRVRYGVSPLGESLEPLLAALCEWGKHHAAEVGQTDEISDCIVADRRSRGGHAYPELRNGFGIQPENSGYDVLRDASPECGSCT